MYLKNNMSLKKYLAKYAYSLNKNKINLSSGSKSNEYIDCRYALSIPSVLYGVAEEVFEKINIPSVSAIGGLTMGADPIAISVSFYSANYHPLNWFSIRKQPKEHGKNKLIEGKVSSGDNVVIVDDVITSGNSVIKAIKACENEGINVSQVIGLVDRCEGGIENIKEHVKDVSCICNIKDLRMLNILR